MTVPDERQESYTHGYEEWAKAWMVQRTAVDAADFLLPHLTPGMRVLDCGCGPGSITAGLAAIAAPGEVIGIDIEPRQVASARALAAERGIANVSFQEGSLYVLPFPDDSFDAALAHTVVEHIADPTAAFREVRRVLKPGGVFGVRDPDYTMMRMEPASDASREGNDLIRRVQALSGGSPSYAPQQRQLLLEAGFSRAEAGAGVTTAGTPQETAMMPFIMQGWIREPAFIRAAAECGYDEAALDRLLEEFTAWSARPDAFWVLVLCHAVAWK
jgi:SAM-dependent methyltransferase